MRTLLLLCACAAALLAGEADPKVAAKALWTSAAKAGDAWTCLQLESWARSCKPAVRLGSILGDSAIIGEPRFSFPARVTFLADLGERLVVVAGGQVHVLAPDGLPLQVAHRIPAWGNYGLGHGGEVLAAWTNEHGEFRLAIVRLADGKGLAAAAVPQAAGQSSEDAVVVADDGSAAAAQIRTEDAATGLTSYGTLVLTAGGQVIRPGLPLGLRGIGRGGAWLIAGEPPRLTVQVGEARSEAVAAAAGPGLAACISGAAARLILADGRQTALAGAPAIGSDPEMATVGGWLVMCSGYGAKMVSEGDLLGEGGGEEVVQPPTLALWRWADLVADPGARPVATVPGELSVSSLHPAALWVWEGRRLDLLDLSGTELRREQRLQAAAPIHWAASHLHCLRLYHDGGVKALYGPDNALLWNGVAEDIAVKRRGLALVTRGRDEARTWSLVRLSADPAQRTEVRLEVPAHEHGIRVSHEAPDMALALGSRGVWHRLRFDGKVVQTAREHGPDGVPAPRCPEWQWFFPTGRFWHDGVRLRSKTEAPGDDPMDSVVFTDAWRFGATSVLLDATGRVLISGRKRGEWMALPAVAPAERLALSGPTPVLVAGEPTRQVASLVPGPKLEAHEGTGGLAELPSGAWRLERRWLFTPPRGRQLEWDEDRLGWRPVRLRSPESGGLLIITPAVVIELDPAAARLFGR